jgi:hypothetical protein
VIYVGGPDAAWLALLVVPLLTAIHLARRAAHPARA